MKKRLFSLLMVLCLICTMLPTSVFAVDVEYLGPVYITEHNPLYPHDDCSVEEHAPTVDALHPLQGSQYEDDLSVAAATIRTAMENRQSTVSVNVFLDGDTHDGSEAANKAMMRGIFHDAYAHTGEATEGDYLRWVYNSMSAGASYYNSGGNYYFTITYTITYYTTAAQEQAVADKLATVMPAFGFTSSTTDYEKVKTIHDYICANVTYDHENLENESYKLKYTAYAALINGTSVCQGYATLLYRMLLMSGVDTRVVIGTAGGGNHGWNIVKLGDVYYNVDSTWDAGETEYDYFLTCPASFDPSHTRDAEYTTAAFNAAYPMASEDYDTNAVSGKCGDNAYWALENGTLTISGSGEMYDYPDAVPAPWEEYRFSITKVVIDDGITKIGADSFLSCTALNDVIIGKDVSYVGGSAFHSCTALTNITFTGDLPAFGFKALYNVTATAIYPCTNDTWTAAKVAELAAAHPSAMWMAGHDFVDGSCTRCGAPDPDYAPTTFADIPADSWQYPFAVYAVKNGLMAGKGMDADGNIIFDPNSPIKREEFVQVLYNAEGKPAISIANPFPDVADGGWYKNAVLWAKQNDIASGKGNGNFGVGENISRQDLAMMLYKYAKLNGYSLAADAGLINGYADGDMVASYAKTAMDWAVSNGIMSGKGTAGADLSTFRLDPTGIATRAECAAMLKNFQTAFGG